MSENQQSLRDFLAQERQESKLELKDRTEHFSQVSMELDKVLLALCSAGLVYTIYQGEEIGTNYKWSAVAFGLAMSILLIGLVLSYFNWMNSAENTVDRLRKLTSLNNEVNDRHPTEIRMGITSANTSYDERSIRIRKLKYWIVGAQVSSVIATLMAIIILLGNCCF